MVLFMVIGFVANATSVIFKLCTVIVSETQVSTCNFTSVSPYTDPKYGNFSNLTSLLYTDMYLGTSNYFNVYTSINSSLFQNDMDQMGYKGVQILNDTVGEEHKYYDVLLNLPYNISNLATGYNSTIVTMDVKALLTYSMCRDSGKLDKSFLASKSKYSNCNCNQYKIPGIYDYYTSANTSICVTKNGETCGDLQYMKYDVPPPPIIAEDPSGSDLSSSIFDVYTPESLVFNTPDEYIKSFSVNACKAYTFSVKMNVDFSVDSAGTKLIGINSYNKTTFQNRVGFDITSRLLPIISILDNQGTTQRPVGSVSYSLSSAIMANLFEPALLKELDFNVPSNNAILTRVSSFPTLNFLGRIILGAIVVVILLSILAIELKYGTRNMDAIALISWIRKSKEYYLLEDINQMNEYDIDNKSSMFGEGQPGKQYTLENDALKAI
ncbi:hypothetical protein HDV04_001514 [Boothiomyces sp. JEL0838]|nr:hypothetical protein HDV04_001514 [Boothiomyces sp. JEL0838]